MLTLVLRLLISQWAYFLRDTPNKCTVAMLLCAFKFKSVLERVQFGAIHHNRDAHQHFTDSALSKGSASKLVQNSGVNRCTTGLSSALTVPHSHRSSGFPPVFSGCCSLLVCQSVRLDGLMASYLSHCLSTLKHFGMRTESQTPAVINAGATVWVKRS